MRCNERKWAAKAVSERSAILYMSRMIANKPLVEKGIVFDISNKYICILIHRLGLEEKLDISRDRIQGTFCEFTGEQPFCTLRVHWKGMEPQNIRFFDEVLVKISTNFKR